MGRFTLIAGGALVLGLLALCDTRAALHHPDEPMALPVRADGTPEPLPFDEFRRRRIILINQSNDKWPLVVLDDKKEPVLDPKTGKRRLTERGVLVERVAAARKTPPPTSDRASALAIDLLRLGKPDEAQAALKGQHRGYLAHVTLAHVSAAQPDPDPELAKRNIKSQNWPRAIDFLSIALEERAPKSLPGFSEQQLAWQMALNRGPLMTYFRIRKDSARNPVPPEDEVPTPLFGAVNFVNAAGVYEPGALAPDQAKKLPPDALATVQQLLLWFPHDLQLYWLLGELYAARGEFGAARRVMDECISTYSNRKLLKSHRELVAKAADAQAPVADVALTADETPAEAAPVPDPPLTLGAVWAYFAGVGAIALFALVRALTRKRPPGDCGPVG